MDIQNAKKSVLNAWKNYSRGWIPCLNEGSARNIKFCRYRNLHIYSKASLRKGRQSTDGWRGFLRLLRRVLIFTSLPLSRLYLQRRLVQSWLSDHWVNHDSYRNHKTTITKEQARKTVKYTSFFSFPTFLEKIISDESGQKWNYDGHFCIQANGIASLRSLGNQGIDYSVHNFGSVWRSRPGRFTDSLFNCRRRKRNNNWETWEWCARKAAIYCVRLTRLVRSQTKLASRWKLFPSGDSFHEL